ncbi:response regulator, partial [Polynucleobacter sp. Latsch14-2]|uniref:response regulator transcription factor n=1 Tax=Polynucleobacter sp. Latsch14-2 TaxID=2576920 RepID=UPI001C0AEAA2
MPSKIKIAVVEDNDDLRSLLLRNIEREGYTVFGADSAESLDDLLIDHVFNLIILDLNLPSEDGISIATRLKKADHDLYIIMATARNSAEARVAGYESGADIYLTKPFSSAELLAAIGSLARR